MDPKTMTPRKLGSGRDEFSLPANARIRNCADAAGSCRHGGPRSRLAPARRDRYSHQKRERGGATALPDTADREGRWP
eukprot:scaffold56964_cov49-Prasinocladus_malaysianus.AAC.1